MRPLQAPKDAGGGDVWPVRVGHERWPLSLAWQTLRAAGAHLAFGSDWPVVSPSPLLGVQAAVTRQAWAPGQPEQGQTLADTQAAYTRDAACAEFQENLKGTLRPGYLAGLVLLSEGMQAIGPENIGQVEPLPVDHLVTTRYNLLNHILTSTEMSTRQALIETGVPGWKPPQ